MNVRARAYLSKKPFNVSLYHPESIEPSRELREGVHFQPEDKALLTEGKAFSNVRPILQFRENSWESWLPEFLAEED